MGATLRVPFARAASHEWPGVLTRVRAADFTMVALTPREPAETLKAFAARPRASRIALIVGTEGAGLSEAAEAAADVRVRIPIDGDVDSLNLAVATGIALYELKTQNSELRTENARTLEHLNRLKIEPCTELNPSGRGRRRGLSEER